MAAQQQYFNDQAISEQESKFQVQVAQDPTKGLFQTRLKEAVIADMEREEEEAKKKAQPKLARSMFKQKTRKRGEKDKADSLASQLKSVLTTSLPSSSSRPSKSTTKASLNINEAKGGDVPPEDDFDFDDEELSPLASISSSTSTLSKNPASKLPTMSKAATTVETSKPPPVADDEFDFEF